VPDYIKVLRPINLIIVFITQFFFYYKLIVPCLTSANLSPSLQLKEMVLFVLVTVIISACGYIINDYFDFKIDRVNKTNNSELNKKNLLVYFYSLLTLGFVISIYIAFQLDKIHLILLYPLAALLLYFYSKSLKLKGFIGNLVIASFCSFSTLILLLAEPQMSYSIDSKVIFVVRTIYAFSIFAFMINLIREIIKDIEDMNGDISAGSNSLPIKIGIARTQILVQFNTVALIAFIIIWTITSKETIGFQNQMFNIIFLVGPLVMSMLKLKKATNTADYTKLSALYKWIMFGGLISIILISNQINF
jgi:4-hydroxybenzoate polyprenyltransferase